MNEMIRAATFAVFCAAVSLTSAQTLTYGPITQPLGRAVDGIATRLGKKLYVDDDIASEPIVLRLKGVSEKDALDRLAEVMSAEWVPYKDGQCLTRTAATLDKANQAVVQRRAEIIRQQLDVLAAVRQKHPTLDADTAREIAHQYTEMMRKESQGVAGTPGQTRKELSNQTAEARLLQDMMQAIGPERLAALSDDSRNVFSVSPTAAQISVPNMDSARIDQFVREHNALANAIQSEDQKGLHDGLLFSGIQQATQPLVKLPTRVCLVVTPSRRIVDLELDVYDADGNKVSSSDWQVGRLDTNQWFKDRDKYLADSAKMPGIRVPAAVAALALRSRAASSPSEPKAVDPAALEYLLHPDVHDPLELGFSQAVIGIGEMENLNVLATLDDEGIHFALGTCRNGEIKPSYFMIVMAQWTNDTIKKGDGWLIAHPNDPQRATRDRTNRPDLAKFVQHVAAQGYTTLEDWANLAKDNPDAAYNTALGYRNMLEAQDWIYDYSNMAVYRLYGLLSDDQLDTLKRGQPLSFSTLSPEEQSCINTIALVQGQAFKSPTDKELNYIDTIHSEPTEEIPGGIPVNATMTMREDVVEQFYANTSTTLTNSTQEMRGEPMDLNSLAVQLAESKRPDLFPLGVENVKSLRYGHKRTITFRIPVTADAIIDARITEMQKPTGNPIAVDELQNRLPSDVWSRLDGQVQKLLASYKEHEVDILKSRPKDNNPPPPPPR